MKRKLSPPSSQTKKQFFLPWRPERGRWPTRGAQPPGRHHQHLVQNSRPNLFFRSDSLRQDGALSDSSSVGAALNVANNFYASLTRAQRSPRPSSKIRRCLLPLPQQNLLLASATGFRLNRRQRRMCGSATVHSATGRSPALRFR